MIHLNPDQARLVVAVLALGALLALGIFVRAEWHEMPERWRVIMSILLVQQTIIAGAFYQASTDPTLTATSVPLRTYGFLLTSAALLIAGGWFASPASRHDRWHR